MSIIVSILSHGASWLMIAVMGVTLVVLLTRYATAPFAPNVPFGRLVVRLVNGRPLIQDTFEEQYSTANRQMRRRLRRNEWALRTQMRIVGWVMCVALLSRLIIFASALVGSWVSGNLVAFFQDMNGHWLRWDALGYLSLAEKGYAASEREYMVLLPLYPLLIRLMRPLFLGNAAAAGYFLSNLFLVGSGWALFLLVRENQGETAARRSVQLFMLCPLSVFFSVPYAESLFLFLTMLSVLLARRHYMVGAAVAGMLAAYTRLAGILTVIPLFLEVLRYEHSIGLWPQHKKRCVRRLALYTLLTAAVALGTAGYLLVNWKVTGDPFAFIAIQAENWSQTFGSMAYTLRYSLENVFFYESTLWRLGVWLPQCLTIILAVFLLLLLSARMDPGDGLYAWAYLAITLAPTWLLTGPRMVATMYALYPMLGYITRSKVIYIALLISFLLLMMVFSYMYAVVGNVL